MSYMLDKFLDYVSYDTQSDDKSSSCPSTKGQLELGKKWSGIRIYIENNLFSMGQKENITHYKRNNVGKKPALFEEWYF